MGKKIKARWTRSASASSRARSSAASARPRRTRSSTCSRKFADYGFNKSHAAAYALVAYQTAYLKANYPVEFLAASMTLDIANTDKLAEFRREAQRLGIKVEPPSINRSGVDFDVDEQGTSTMPSRRSRASARQAIEALVEARGDAPFSRPRRFRARASTRAPSTSARWRASSPPAPSMSSSPNRARACAAVDAMTSARPARARGSGGGQSTCSAASPRRRAARMPPRQPWPAGRAAAARI